MKVGMIPIWDKWGNRHATTVLQLDECQVVQVKTLATEGYTAMQLGVGEAKLKRVNKPDLGHYQKAEVKPKRKLMEFRVTEDALLPVGTPIKATHFVPGQVMFISLQPYIYSLKVCYYLYYLWYIYIIFR